MYNSDDSKYFQFKNYLVCRSCFWSNPCCHSIIDLKTKQQKDLTWNEIQQILKSQINENSIYDDIIPSMMETYNIELDELNDFDIQHFDIYDKEKERKIKEKQERIKKEKERKLQEDNKRKERIQKQKEEFELFINNLKNNNSEYFSKNPHCGKCNFIEDNKYIDFGEYKIGTFCYLTYPCQHDLICKKTNKKYTLTSPKIKELLEHFNLTYQHFN